MLNRSGVPGLQKNYPIPGSSLVLLRIPSSRPSPRTFPQFVRVQVLGFMAAENDGFET